MCKIAAFIIGGSGLEGMEGEAGRRLIRHLLRNADKKNIDYFEVDKVSSLKAGDLRSYNGYDVFIFIYGILFITHEGVNALSEIVRNNMKLSFVAPVSNASRISHQQATPPFLYQTISVFDWAASEIYKKFKDEVMIVSEIDDFCFAVRKDVLHNLPKDCSVADLPHFLKNSGLNFGIAKGVYVHRYGDCYESGRDDLIAHVPADAKEILDVGSAAGFFGELLKKRQRCVVTGVDIDIELIDIARKRLDDVFTGDIEDLIDGKKLGIYDCIVCGDVLEHLNNPWNVVRGLKTHLRKGGIFIASTPNVINWAVIYEQLKGRWDYVPFSILSGTHIRFFTKNTLIDIFEGAGYKIVEVLLQSFEIPPGGLEFIKSLNNISPGINEEELKASEIVLIAEA
jgi:2-polyprenyl-3-methyl-5-hydroxy-6-metoxy-1,4-benzoquinol methylase